MKDLKRLIAGGLTLIGLGAVGYKAYQMKKLNDSIKNENVIEIEVETKEETRK